MCQTIFIAAVASNGVMGCEGSMPWKYPKDIERFKRVTMGYPIVMGRKTWDSLPIKPLPGRTNIVLTKKKDFDEYGCVAYDDLRKVIWIYNSSEKIYVIGGAAIFNEYMDFADVLDITHIHQEYAGDTYFPYIDRNVWAKQVEFTNDPDITFTRYERKIMLNRF